MKNNIKDIYYSTFLCAVPAPISPLVFRQGRGGDLYEGTTYTFTCVVTPNRTGVDTEFTVESSVSGPRTSDTARISILPPAEVNSGDYETSVMFHALHLNDSGTYTCTATVTSTSPYVSTSEPSIGMETITVDSKNYVNVPFLFPSDVTSIMVDNMTVVLFFSFQFYLPQL